MTSSWRFHEKMIRGEKTSFGVRMPIRARSASSRGAGLNRAVSTPNWTTVVRSRRAPPAMAPSARSTESAVTAAAPRRLSQP